MAASIFDDETRPPTRAMLSTALGAKAAVWDEPERRLAAQHPPLTEEWNYAGKNYGWSLRLKQKSRAVVYLTPCNGFFRTSFALGEKAARAAHAEGLSAEILRVIDEAPRYAEGRAVRFEVRWKKELSAVLRVATVKMAN